MTKNEWEVGDKAKGRYLVEVVELVFVGKYHYVAENENGESIGFIEDLRPVKTPEEFEQERVVDLALSQDCVPPEGALSRKAFCGELYRVGMLVDPSKKVKPLSVDKWLIDSGYSKNGSVSNFINELIDEGYIIGADNE